MGWPTTKVVCRLLVLWCDRRPAWFRENESSLWRVRGNQINTLLLKVFYGGGCNGRVTVVCNGRVRNMSEVGSFTVCDDGGCWFDRWFGF